MKESIKKVYPILIAPLCLVAGILSYVFFFCGPVAKGNYDILAIGSVAILLSIIQIIMIVIEIVKRNKNK